MNLIFAGELITARNINSVFEVYCLYWVDPFRNQPFLKLGFESTVHIPVNKRIDATGHKNKQRCKKRKIAWEMRIIRKCWDGKYDMSRHKKTEISNHSDEQGFADFDIGNVGRLPWNISIVHFHFFVNLPVTEHENEIRRVHKGKYDRIRR